MGPLVRAKLVAHMDKEMRWTRGTPFSPWSSILSLSLSLVSLSNATPTLHRRVSPCNSPPSEGHPSIVEPLFPTVWDATPGIELDRAQEPASIWSIVAGLGPISSAQTHLHSRMAPSCGLPPQLCQMSPSPTSPRIPQRLCKGILPLTFILINDDTRVIRLKRIYNFWCSMLVFTPFALCFVTLRGVFMRFPELTY
jgi:hypothetical protein